MCWYTDTYKPLTSRSHSLRRTVSASSLWSCVKTACRERLSEEPVATWFWNTNWVLTCQNQVKCQITQTASEHVLVLCHPNSSAFKLLINPPTLNFWIQGSAEPLLPWTFRVPLFQPAPSFKNKRVSRCPVIQATYYIYIYIHLCICIITVITTIVEAILLYNYNIII